MSGVLLSAPPDPSCSLSKVPDHEPMVSRIDSSCEIPTVEALCNSNKVLVSFKYPPSEFWNTDASAT